MDVVNIVVTKVGDVGTYVGNFSYTLEFIVPLLF